MQKYVPLVKQNVMELEDLTRTKNISEEKEGMVREDRDREKRDKRERS